MNAKSAITAATLACSLAAALATSAAKAGPAAAQPGADKCYGVAPRRQERLRRRRRHELRGHLDRRLRPRSLEICRQGHLRRHDDPEGPRLADRDVGPTSKILLLYGPAPLRPGRFVHPSGKSSILNSASARSPRSASALSRWRNSTRRILPDTSSAAHRTRSGRTSL